MDGCGLHMADPSLFPSTGNFGEPEHSTLNTIRSLGTVQVTHLGTAQFFFPLFSFGFGATPGCAWGTELRTALWGYPRADVVEGSSCVQSKRLTFGLELRLKGLVCCSQMSDLRALALHKNNQSSVPRTR